ncbi:MAG: monovalent cation/H(+) antiporter subunit G [Bacillus sp. (in: Bacteria)]|nr:monovalent cation/H(+) antiporter subunit G [Bacillus sp. (in: firmicutes)]MCM1426764.1 monovalent cation/H(+) antiporter subunit G [Eubacterium sp.]
MEIIEWIRFLAGALFMIFGLFIFLIEMIGVFRFQYVLNRMHAAAMGDTLGIACSLIGLMIMSGFTFTSLKLFCVIAFLWFSSPTSSHLIARLEVATNEDREAHYTISPLDELEAKSGEEKSADRREN